MQGRPNSIYIRSRTRVCFMNPGIHLHAQSVDVHSSSRSSIFQRNFSLRNVLTLSPLLKTYETYLGTGPSFPNFLLDDSAEPQPLPWLQHLHHSTGDDGLDQPVDGGRGHGRKFRQRRPQFLEAEKTIPCLIPCFSPQLQYTVSNLELFS